MMTDIWNAVVEVYTHFEMTDNLPILKEYLLNNAKNVGEITDWTVDGLWLGS